MKKDGEDNQKAKTVGQDVSQASASRPKHDKI